MATPRIRRESYRDCDIMVSADEITPMRAGASPLCIGSYLIYCEGKMTHNDTLAENFATCDEAEAAAFVVARQWIDSQLAKCP